MRSIREYIRKTLFDSSSILPAYRHDAPQRVKEFAFVRAPVPWSGLPTCCREASCFPTRTMCIV